MQITRNGVTLQYTPDNRQIAWLEYNGIRYLPNTEGFDQVLIIFHGDFYYGGNWPL